ncbi:MAG: DNA-3-methyladenine glycosylase 2 family protein [Sinobacteraceae bacterium]|nr:DNA-3-methyladenine glycosylase 2 family protein [Nevskiaceae bacterium]
MPALSTPPQPTRRRLAPHFAAVDPVMAALIEAAGPYRLRVQPCASPFRHLAEAIIGQQISGAAARAITARVVALVADGEHRDGFPTPGAVLALPDTTLRGAGLSASKVLALRDLALKTAGGEVPQSQQLYSLDDETIIEQLTAVRGIGRWTVQMMLMFQLGRTDVLPTADFGVRNGFRIAYRRRTLPTPGELLVYGEHWAPWRSAAAWYLWRAVDLHRAGTLPVLPKPARLKARAGARAAPQPRSGARTR